MITMTTWTPADLLGLGGPDARPVNGPALCDGLVERAVAPSSAPVAPAQGTGLPVDSAAIRLRPVTRQAIGHDVVTTDFFDNTGTTLGIPSSRRPQS